MELTLYRDTSGFAALQGEWNDLLHRSRFDTIFLTWEWQSTWWRSLGESRGPLYLLALRDEGRLVGIIPLYLTGTPGNYTLSVVGCVEVSDYLDMIMEQGQEDAVYAAFAQWLNSPDAPAWNCLELCNQPGSSLSHTDFPVIARQMGWFAEIAQEDVCPVVTLPTDFDAYLEGLDKKQRHEIRRKLRRVERETPDACFRVVSGGPELSAAMDSFITLHRLSRTDKEAFMTGDMAAFFRELAETLAHAGWLELSFLDIGGQPAATYFCFNYHGDTLVYNSGYDPQSYPQLSAGWVLLAHVIEYAISQGRAHLDFLQGNEDYKYRFGGVDTSVWRTLIRRN